jgi:16S rRNA (guanine527-N7)-methyltransferase
MLFPNVQFDLADSIGKKVLVVADIAERLALPNVRTLNVRAETLRRDYDYVTGRAVTALPQFLKLAKQCLRTRQSDAGVLYWQGGDPAETQRETGIAPAKLLSLESALNDARFSGKYIAFYPRSALR